MKSKVFALIDKEKTRQDEELMMIPSENYVSENVLKALGSVLTNKYSEGFPKARYYAGNSVIDEIEIYAQELANKVFGTEYAIVQAYSGSPANMAVYLALAAPNDPITGLKLTSGGHLTHGAEASQTGKLFHSFQYDLDLNNRIDFKQVEKIIQEKKPKLIWVGATAYPYNYDWKKFSQLADRSGAYLIADISHTAGLIAAGVHSSPTPFAHVITTTTHKTLRGPRGALILVTKKGLAKDPDLPSKLEKSLFPGLQGGPHNHQTAAIAVALEEALTPQFKAYAKQVLKNNLELAKALGTETENHLILLDLSSLGFGLGYQAHIALEIAGIIVNKNTVPREPASAYYPSGIRLGTPALTSRGMKEADMKYIAGWIKQALQEIKGYDLPKEQSERRDFISNFKKIMRTNKKLLSVRQQVKQFTRKFPIPKNY